MANVKITALEHLSSTQVAPEDVFIIDQVGPLITKKITLSNVTKYISTTLGNAKVVDSNLNSFASYANANAAALSSAIANISANFSIVGDTGSDTVAVGVETLRFSGQQGISTNIGANEVIVSLANTGIVSGSYGGTNGATIIVPTFTVNAQGRLVNVQNTSVTVDLTAIQANIDTVQSNLTSNISTVSNTLSVSIATANSVIASLSANLGSLSSLATSTKTNAVASINEVVSYVGYPTALTTSVKTNTVSAINELVVSIGSLSLLTTVYKSNIVIAINEVLSYLGDVNSLSTTANSNLVAAVNEVNSPNRALNSITMSSFTQQATISSNVNSIGTVVFSQDKSSMHFAKLLINVEDLTYGQYQSSEILLVQDEASVKTVEYAMIYTSTNPIATFDASIVGNNVELYARTVSADNRINIFKIIS